MSSLKRKLARSAGEKLALKQGKFPVDVKEIARDEGIEIYPLPGKKRGVSGGITFTEPPIIFHTQLIKSEGFVRFTIAHELGHYFTDGHEDAIIASGNSHISRAGSGAKELIEQEADQFAVGLLMPASYSNRVLEHADMGLAGIEALSDAANVSLIAAALRLVALDPYPVAICSSIGPDVVFCSLSESFRDLGFKNWPRPKDRLPLGTGTAVFNADRSGAPRYQTRTCLSEWMDAPGMMIEEQVVSQGSYEGRSLTVLTGDTLVARLDGDDEEEDVDASWTPRFKR